MERNYRMKIYMVSLLHRATITRNVGQCPTCMVALPNTGGALCSTPQSLADAHYQMPCSNDVKTRNQLKFAEGASNYRIDLSR